jgi:mono/diheme cytochrome c family protein
MLRDLSLWALLALTGCELGVPAGEGTFYELNMLNMGDQPKLKPQREDIFGTRRLSLVEPPEGTVPVGVEPYPYTQEQVELAAAALVNPLPASPEVLEQGEYVFTRFCQVCHGVAAEGDGPVTRKFPEPPSLNRQRARDYTDGHIFHVAMRGQNVMPSYGKQIEPDEIWAAVHWIRKLQAENPVAPPTEDDLALLEKQATPDEPLPGDEAAPANEAAPSEEGAEAHESTEAK